MIAGMLRASQGIEKAYLWKLFLGALRRLADCSAPAKCLHTQVAEERIPVPPTAIINIDRQRSDSAEEIQRLLKWPVYEWQTIAPGKPFRKPQS